MDTTFESSVPAASAWAEESYSGHGPTMRQELTRVFLAEKSYFLRVASSIVHDFADAEDAVHTAFCSAWKVIDAFRGDSSIKTWFVRIVQNAALSMLRKRHGDRMVALEDDPEYLQSYELRSAQEVDDPERSTMRREQLHLMREQLGRLPEETRIVVSLYLAGDLSIDAIASMRRKSRPSVVAHLQRGKATLRKRVLHATTAGRRARPSVSL